MHAPWLSVIIPTYNGEKYLSSCLESIVSQQAENVECIAIDDGSIDSTLNILESFSGKLNLKILKEKRTGNWAANTNKALSIVRGKYISFLHQDDIWSNNRLKILVESVEKYPQIGLFLSPSIYIDSKGNKVGFWRCPLPPSFKPITSDFLTERLLVQNFISIPAPLFKRELAVSAGGLNEKLWYTADWDFWLKLAGKTECIYRPEFLTSFRIHRESQTIAHSGIKGDFSEQLDVVLKRHLGLLENVPEKRKGSIVRAARFSIQMNVALAAVVNEQQAHMASLIVNFLRLGPLGWQRYLRDSRIIERISARYKIGVQDIK